MSKRNFNRVSDDGLEAGALPQGYVYDYCYNDVNHNIYPTNMFNVPERDFTAPEFESNSLWEQEVFAKFSREMALSSLSQNGQLYRGYAEHPSPSSYGANSAFSPSTSSTRDGFSPLNTVESPLLTHVDPDHELEFEFHTDMGMVWRASQSPHQAPSLMPSTRRGAQDGQSSFRNDTPTTTVEHGQISGATHPMCEDCLRRVISDLSKLGGQLQGNARQQMRTVGASDLMS